MKATDLNQAFHYVEDAYLAEVDAPDKENQTMKNKKRIRYIFLAAALICLLSITVYAAELLNIHSYYSGSSKIYEKHSEMGRALAQVGLQAEIPESFASGFRFQSAEVQDVDAMDENGEQVLTFKELIVYYKDERGQMLALRLREDLEELPKDERTPASEKTVGGVELSFYQDIYRFVPEDYQLSAEEQEWADQPGHYVSYGADEVQEKIASFLLWTENDINYSIMNLGWEAFEADTLFMMAEEMIH